jgi:hypothetical protein
MKAIGFLLPALLLFTGCQAHKIQEDKFIKVYTDIMIAQDTSRPNTNINLIKQQVFNKDGVTEKQYDYTVDYYNKDPKKWEAFFNKAITYLESQKSKKH